MGFFLLFLFVSISLGDIWGNKDPLTREERQEFTEIVSL
jgi:hypothetical protein